MQKHTFSFKENQINDQVCKNNYYCNQRAGRNRLFFVQHMPSLHNVLKNNEMRVVVVNHRLIVKALLNRTFSAYDIR